jgi:hypothetical protein
MNDPDGTEAIDEAIALAIREHNPRLDSVLFNGGTIVALAATISATALPWTGSTAWAPRLLSGAAALLIGIERALNFGERWRYHLRMRSSYRGLRTRLALARALTGERRREAVDRIVDDLQNLQRVEGDLPRGVAPENQA